MKKRISDYLNKNIRSNYEWKVIGKDSYFQAFIEAGEDINMECFKHAIKSPDIDECEFNIDVSCVHNDELGYCLMIEVYW